jgi:hypothetical protein
MIVDGKGAADDCLAWQRQHGADVILRAEPEVVVLDLAREANLMRKALSAVLALGRVDETLRAQAQTACVRIRLQGRYDKGSL